MSSLNSSVDLVADERRLMERVAARDEQALAAIYDRYSCVCGGSHKYSTRSEAVCPPGSPSMPGIGRWIIGVSIGVNRKRRKICKWLSHRAVCPNTVRTWEKSGKSCAVFQIHYATFLNSVISEVCHTPRSSRAPVCRWGPLNRGSERRCHR